jgi:broad specificity phosphatase PhoE
MLEFREEIFKPAKGKVLVVAHGSVLNAMLCYLMKTPVDWLWAYPFDYGNGGEVALYDKHASLLRFNSLV